MILSDFDSVSEIFSDTKHRAAFLCEMSFLWDIVLIGIEVVNEGRLSVRDELLVGYRSDWNKSS